MILNLIIISIIGFSSLYSSSGYKLENIPQEKKQEAILSGKIDLDTSWDQVIYLSLIPTFNEMNAISNQMIVAKAIVDSTGYFEFDLDFIPEETRLYRLHIVKKGDNLVSLIIGGQNQNHTFILLNRSMNLYLTVPESIPPFTNTIYNGSEENAQFQEVYQLITSIEKEASESNSAKRTLLYQQLHYDLITFMDTSRFNLPVLYAYYEYGNYKIYSDKAFTYSLSERVDLTTPYSLGLTDIQNRNQNSGNLGAYYWLILLIIPGIWYLWQRYQQNDTISGYEELSVQERRILDLLKQGKTNQEISDECSIAISTVKSHVSSIYSKLNIRSRKEAMNLQ